MCYSLYTNLNVFDTLCFGIVFAGPRELQKLVRDTDLHQQNTRFLSRSLVREKSGLLASFWAFLAPKTLNHGYQTPKAVWRAFLKSWCLATENAVSLWTREVKNKVKITAA